MNQQSETISRQHVTADLDLSTQQLASLLELFDSGRFNTRLIPGKWTAAEVSEHLLLLDRYIVRALQGPVKAVERDPEEKITRIRDVFSNFERQLSSPEVIKPSESPKEREALISGLVTVRSDMAKAVEICDLTQICTSFMHPAFGEFTRVEWIYFSICHSERHMRQLKTLLEA